MIAGVLCQKKVAVVGVERWFKFDAAASGSPASHQNSGTLANAKLKQLDGNFNHTTTGANTGLSINVTSGSSIIKSENNFALGTNFYVEFYATWVSPSASIRIVESDNGFTIRKAADGKIEVITVLDSGTVIRTALSYDDNVKRKFKVTFISGTVTLYVDNVQVATGTSVITDYILSRSLIMFLIFANANGYYDDLIIHRNVIP
jgi:hypothetical protein